jgi:TetR/AcrR family transcriptional regulator, transcriptional repressor for nem operon
MPRVSDAKEKLTEAALGLIWTSGYGATSVDDICAKANVKKGSFYHFFKSKADLEIAALEENWQRSRQRWNDIFSPTVPPLQRLEDYFDFVIQRQGQLLEEYGSVLGCPFCSVGSEVSSRESGIRDKTLQIMDRYVKYFESAIRDADAQGMISAPDAKTKARALYAYFQGVMAQARIANSLTPLQELKAGAWALLGVRQPEPAVA